ncbi:MAG: hypothetical protein GXO85_03290 [Chlorobi bacterium]|nr:hypothetical protein [Chlorobiota bacterium]
MYKKISLMILAAAITMVIFNSCEKGTEPEELQPGRRDYTWTIDTINPGPTYRTYGFNLWGAAPNDLWMVGGADTRSHPIWHYDGKEWSNVILDEFITGAGIVGFASDDVWMGTTNSSIWHYDGDSWSKFGEYKYKDYDRITIQSMHGINRNEIYGVGFADKFDGSRMTRILMKYNGTEWNFIDIPELEEYFSRVKVNKVNNDIYIISNRRNSPDHYYHLYIVENDSLVKITSSDDYISFADIDGEIFPIVGKTINKYEKNKLIPIIDLEGTDFKSRAWGRSKIDFITVNVGSELGHYNGSNLINIVNVQAAIGEAVVFEKDIFIHGKEYNNFLDIIIHGKLK